MGDVPSSNCCPTIVRVGPTIGADQPTFCLSATSCGSFYRNKTMSASGLVGCDSRAAWPGVRESTTADASLVNILTGTLEKNWRFAVAFSKDSAGNPTLVVTSDNGPWMTNLAFTCCGACAAGTVPLLEEVDLSDNRISGPPPLSFQKLKASVRKLKLTDNSFSGDYTPLAEVQRTFLRADLQRFGLEMLPQRQCAVGTYAHSHAGVLDDVPTCTPIPVRPKRAYFAALGRSKRHVFLVACSRRWWRCICSRKS